MVSYSKLQMTVTRVIAGVVTGLLVLTGLVTGAPGTAPAFASSGTISDVELRVLDDGTSVAPGDDATDDGLIGLGNKAQFSWTMMLTDLDDGEIQQTLPEGWAWDRASLDASGLHNPGGANGYLSTYELSKQNRVLTVKIASAGAGAQLVEFDTLLGGPTRFDDAVGVVYSPTLLVTDGDAAQEIAVTGEPQTLESVGIHVVDLRKRSLSSGGGTVTAPGKEKDFGAGPEAAVGHTFGVSLRNESVKVAGTRPVLWDKPVRVADTYTLTGEGIDQATLPQLIEISATPTFGVTAELENIDTAAGSFDIVFDGEKLDDDAYYAGYGSVEVTIYLPKRLVPMVPKTPISIVNTVAESPEFPWQTVSGEPISNAGNSTTTVNGWYQLQDDSLYPPTRFEPQTKDSLKYADEENTKRFNKTVFPGYEFRHYADFQPYGVKPRNAVVTDVPPTEDLNFFEFWKRGEITLSAPGKLVTDSGEVLRADVDYRVLVTDEAGPEYSEEGATADPLALAWVPINEYQGNQSDLTGIRYEFLDDYTVNDGMPVEKMTQSRVAVNTLLKVVRQYPNGMPDAGLVGVQSMITAKTASETNPEYRGQTRSEVIIRGSSASTSVTGRGLSDDGVPQREKDPITAGQRVRYTAATSLTRVEGGPAAGSDEARNIAITGLQVNMRLPENIVLSTVDFSQVDTRAWRWEFGASDSEGNTPLTFFYKLPLHAMQEVPEVIQIDARTSQIAPADDGWFQVLVTTTADQVYLPGSSSYENHINIRAAQANAAKVEIEAITPELDAAEPAEFEVDWFNFLSSSQGLSTFVSVLPFTGDARGTRVTGPITLMNAELSAHPRQGAQLQLTTDTAVRSSPPTVAPADSVTWVNYGDASADQIEAATALRVVVTDLVSGEDSIGRLSFSVHAPESRKGDVFASTVSGSLKGGSVLLAEAEPARANVTAAEVSGVIWDDANGDGKRDDGEHVLRDVTVVLTRDSNEIGRTQTDAHGAYVFGDLVAGDVVVNVDTATLPDTSGAWTSTASPSGGDHGISGVIRLGRGGEAPEQDFGFQNLVPQLELGKQGIAPKTPLPGEPLTWEFTVENTGNTELTDVTLHDELPGLSAIEFEQWPDASRPGVLQPGEQAHASATSALTQQQLDAGVATNQVTGAASSAVVTDPVTASAEASVPIAGFAAVAIEKSVGIRDVIDPATAVAGDIVDYEFSVMNTGTLTLHDVDIVDPLNGLGTIVYGAWPEPTQPATLAPGQSVTATASLVLTQAHIDAGTLKNAAVVSAKTPKGREITDDDDAFLVFDNTPALDLDKRVAVQGSGVVGDTVTYRFELTNVGRATLHEVALSDPLPGLSEPVIDWPGSAGELAPGEQAVGTASVTITQAHVDAGVLSNTATAEATHLVSDEKTSDTDTAQVVFTQQPKLEATKTGTLRAADHKIDYTVTAKNSGNVTLTDVTLTDELDGLPDLKLTWPGTPGQLAPGAIVTGSATLRLSQAQIDAGAVTNTAQADAVGAGEQLTASATVTTNVPGVAALNVSTTTQVQGRDSIADAVAGDTIEYTFTVTNDGTLTLRDPQISSDLADLSGIVFGPWPGTVGELAPGTSVTATATLTLTQAHIDAGSLTGTVTVDASSLSGNAQARDTDTHTIAFDARPLIALQKAVRVTGDGAVGDTLEYDLTVTNSGKSTLRDVSIRDDLAGLSEVEFGDWPATAGVLLPGESVSATAQIEISQAHIDAGAVVNMATATGRSGSESVSDSSTAEARFVQAAGVELQKTAKLTLSGERVNYTITARNSGNVTLTDVRISDELRGLSALDIEWPQEAGTLAPGEQATATAHLLITDAHRGTTVTNQAGVSAKLPDGNAVHAQAQVDQQIPAQPGVIGVIGTLVATGGIGFWALFGLALLLSSAGVWVLLARRRVAHEATR